jgi:hypothetical protein
MKILKPEVYLNACFDGRKWLIKHFPNGISIPLSKKDYNKIYNNWTAWNIGQFVYQIFYSKTWLSVKWVCKSKLLKAASDCFQKGKVTKKILLKHKLIDG